MEEMNRTQFNGFILLGLSDIEDIRILLFVFFLSMFLLTLTANMLIIMAVQCHARLHTPMYFYIKVLSFLEIWYTSSTAPKHLSLLLSKDNRISYGWCFAQLYMFHSLGTTDCALLAVMAFDRCMAICNPLRYTTIMNDRMCRCLATLSWAFGFLTISIPLAMTINVPLCRAHIIDHYFCDLAPLLALACTDISFTIAINSSVIGFAIMFNFIFILIMYINIIWAIMKLQTNAGRMKAFSTCSSHLIIVAIIYGSAFSVYGSPKGPQTANYEKLFSLVYTVFTPFLNPIIFSLRNNEMKIALSGIFQGKWHILMLK
ncbi:olfactory receptor 6N2-like [Xenopus tropicalis]|uniref:Olfactory receptor n=1 Tax=Xenopus tropicalis TaxID=8364 RepID=A0A6I8PVS7_XENTR|nr:olfactory receptor 6N2-like [Xenopus tropicalis]